jgi:prepilin-type N-terminal cleavage/methylation domain-containing protein
MKTLQKGFTLIELLVVIAIIGILSSIVLASLSSARTKGEDAAIQSTLSNMRAQTELFYSQNNGYATTTGTITSCTSGIFGDTGVGGLKTLMTALTSRTTVSCNASSSAWSVAANFKTSGWACVDSTGASVASTTSALSATTTVAGNVVCR